MMGLGEALVNGDRSRRWDARTLSGCCLWLHADAYVWDGSNVTTILDQSGLGNDLYQPTVARRLATAPASTPFFNGRRTFSFPTTKDKWYGRVGGLSGMPFGQTPYTMFMVASRSEATDLNGDCLAIVWWKDTAVPNAYMAFKAASNTFETFPGTQLTDTVECNPIDTPSIWCYQCNNQSAYNFQNNVPRRQSDGVGAFGAAVNPFMRLGANEGVAGPNANGNYVGNIAEVIIYSKFLSPDERTEVFNQLGGYYDIPVAGGWGGRIG